MFVQILLTSTIRNIWRTLRRICILILGLKGLRGRIRWRHERTTYKVPNYSHVGAPLPGLISYKCHSVTSFAAVFLNLIIFRLLCSFAMGAKALSLLMYLSSVSVNPRTSKIA